MPEDGAFCNASIHFSFIMGFLKKSPDFIRRCLAFISIVGGAALVIPACVENETTLFIRGCMVRALDTCEASADPTAAMFSGGTLDSLFASEYNCPLLIGNQAFARGDDDSVRTESSRVQISTADVRIKDTAGNTVTRSDGSAAEYSVSTSGFIDPGTASEPGYGLAIVTLIDPSTSQSLTDLIESTSFAQDVVVSVVVRGQTLGGNDVESGEWTYPIRVCYGCLCSEPATDSCTAPTEDPDANCAKGLDNPVDCRFYKSNCSDLIEGK